MKEIISEYGKSVLLFTIGGLIIFVVMGIFVWGKDELSENVFAKEDITNYESDKEFKEIINTDVDVNVARDIQKNKLYALRDIVKGPDYIDVVKADNPSKVCFDKDSIMFLDSGVFSLYVDVRKDTGESSRMWVSIGVDG
ncbi:MAG: hypothetical protein E7279_03560 [Lachnospiraceae bacterium]|nr:hypothetical protein [Lachnospiraceae bacterium]